MIKGKINKLIPFSSVDGPGNRFAIFMQGCNFNCGYCHNPETISHSYSKVLKLYPDEVMEEVNKAIPFIRGVTVSGGECTLQLEFLYELFKLCRKKDLTCFIDTNGSVPLWQNQELINLIDGVMLDVKSFSSEDHINITSMDNKIVLRNLEYLLSVKKLYEIRTVIVEGLFDCAETVKNISKMISGSEVIYKLIKYRPIGVRNDFKEKWDKTPSEGFMNELKSISEINHVIIMNI